MRLLAVWTVALVAAGVAISDASAASVVDTPTFHGNRARLGWDSHESVLTPASVSGGSFGPVWSSPQLDSATINGSPQAPHLYASPLYLDNVQITSGTYAGHHFGVVFAATGAGYVYAIKAFDVGGASGVPDGTILWRTWLGTPSAGPDGGVALGVLGTPTIDLNATPPRIYVASDVTDANGRNWQVFALDLGSGSVLPGWPLVINNATLAPINVNGPATFQPASAMSQRGGLNLSPDGRLLYVPFGAYNDGAVGVMVAVDTVTPKLASAFSGAPSTAAAASGGMWGSGGPAIDAAGNVYETTGNSPSGSGPATGVWGNSLLRWGAGSPLKLTGTYSPWNYCLMDQYDTDLGGSSPAVLPSLAAGSTSTPNVVVFGGKQGNAYAVDRAHLPGSRLQRHPCSSDPSSDGSLLPPGPQPQFGVRGPLNIFGPYSDDANNQVDFAKARSTPAYFRGPDGSSYVFFSGSTKVAIGSRNVQPPSLVKAKVMTAPGQPVYFSVAAQDTSLSFLNPGSPVVTSNGSANAVVWVLDENQFRTQPLVGSSVAHPVLYAVDASNMNVLWQSSQSQLNVGGKYSTPTIAHGVVFVGTDRIQAFGLPSK